MDKKRFCKHVLPVIIILSCLFCSLAVTPCICGVFP